jgi:hypothetical protein
VLLARLVERITRNFGEKWLTGAAFLDVAKAFDTVWIDGLLYKLTILNILFYRVWVQNPDSQPTKLYPP